MKVAVVSATALPSPAPSYGGLESIAAYVAESLALVYDTTLYAAKGSHTTRATLRETVAPSYEPAPSWPIEGSAWEVMRSELSQFDVIIDHSHAFHAYRHKLAHPAARVIKVVHDLFPSLTPPPRGSYDILAGVSKFHGAFLSERWGTPVSHFYNGIPTDRLIYSKTKDNYLLFLSRLDPGKGAHIFLDLVARLGQPKAIIAGEDDPAHGISPEYRRQILARSRDLGVEYLGQVSDAEKKKLLANAKAVVVPLDDPYREVFGIWMVEALASGTPVFTTNKGACREILTRETGGAADTVDHLVEALRLYLKGEFEFDPEACRARAQAFDIGAMGAAYANAVESLSK